MTYPRAWLGGATGRGASCAGQAALLLAVLGGGCARAGVGDLEPGVDASVRVGVDGPGGGADSPDASGGADEPPSDGTEGAEGSDMVPSDSGEGSDVGPSEDAAAGGDGSDGPGPADASAGGSDDASTGGCGAGQLDCGSGCVDVRSSPTTCGSCDVSCPGTGATCSDGQCALTGCSWATYGGHDYFLCSGTQPRSWADARSVCRQLGLDLVVLDDASEQAWLKDQVSVTGGWLGFSDLDAEGTWRRIDTADGGNDGAIVWSGGPASSGGSAQNGAFVVWSGIEPNDANGNEDCAYQIGDTWWDGVCTETKPFTCESR